MCCETTRPSLRSGSCHPIALHAIAAAAMTLAVCAGCHSDMYDQPRAEALSETPFFENGLSARELPEGVVARGHLRLNDALYRGVSNDAPVTELPLKVDEKLLARGQERFNIVCANCHGRVGDGDGMIVRRGYRRPPSFHTDKLRGAAVGHIFDVATNGFGAMPAYGRMISTEDRWAIVAYVRALQLSQYPGPEERMPAGHTAGQASSGTREGAE